jgi:ubiquitin-protein ligase
MIRLLARPKLYLHNPEPNPDDAVEAKIADQYKADRSAFDKEAREWTKRYATGKK